MRTVGKKSQTLRCGLMVAAAVTVVLGLTSAGHAGTVLFDADGAGASAAPTAIGGFTLGTGNTLSLGSVPLANIAPGMDLGLLYQATINGFTDTNGDPLGAPPGLNSTYELTLVLRYNETVTGVGFDGSGNPTFASFALSANQTGSFIEIYYDTNKNGNALNGTGYNDGKLIFQGLPSPNLDNNGGFTFQPIPYPPGTNTALDQFGTNNYPGVTTLLGTGSAKVGSYAQLQDPNFFVTPVSQITLNGNLNLPFSQTNPSAFFDGLRNLTGLGTSGVAPAVIGVASVGANNGTGGPNFIFQTIANASLEPAAAPEPGTVGMALVGIGAMAFRVVRSRRRARSSVA